ncbi:MAG TPA: hypothetical protein VF179_32130 [Thermoanaerobaculia bacterium]|nr:hypothetical protein [Thermoanaerobaculia bacterium]
MHDDEVAKAEAAQAELQTFLTAVRQRHDRVNPCFMTGKGCVYTDQIDQALKLREEQEACRGFMIMPFRPRLRVFFENCLRPFFYSNYDRDADFNVGAQPAPNKFALERADDVSRPGIIICEGICKRIQECDFIVADISVPNDNVFYELGLAYGIGNKILLIHQRGAEFGSKWAEYLRPQAEEHTDYTVKQYDSLQMINREQFKASQYLWKRQPSAVSETRNSPDVLFFEMMADGNKEPDPPPTGLHDDDILLSFRTHVLSDIGIALGRIAASLQRQEVASQNTIPSEYLDKIIRKHLDKASIVEPTDPFSKTRDRVDQCYCLIVRTGMDCHPMSYFWLGYGHARGKNVIPITQLVLERPEGAIDGLHQGRDKSIDSIRQTEYRNATAKGKVVDLAFDIRAQRHMTFDPQRPELLEHQLEQTLTEMIRADFSEWSRKRFWANILGSRGEVSIITGGLHSEDHNREMIGDWDLRAASELTSYFSRHQYRPKIETPIYQPEFARHFDESMTTGRYIEQVTKEIRIADKNCVVIASPDVNPLTEILLGRLFGVKDSVLFSTELKAEDYPDAIIVYKQRKRQAGDRDTGTKVAPQHRSEAPRAFYREVVGEGEIEERGFRSRGFARSEKKLLPYYGQNEYERRGERPFKIYAQLVIARNPFASREGPARYVVILNGVSGPATFALTHVLTGGGNEEFESYKQSGFDPAATSESILNKFLPLMTAPNFRCIECVIEVEVGEEPKTQETRGLSPERTKTAQGAGATFDWRRILRWRLDKDVLGLEVKELPEAPE